MLFLKGDICITNNIQVLEQCRFTHKIIIIGEPEPHIIENYNAISGSLFIPPYEAVMQEMDGNLENFRMIYYRHLFSVECQEYIALIFKALYSGKNILLYLSKDESELMYSKVLIEFLSTNFGLYISPDPNTPAGFQQQFSTIVCDLLYTHDLFTFEELLMNRDNQSFNPMILQKLVNELNPYVLDKTYKEYDKYFINLQNIMKEQQKLIVPGLIFEENV